MALRLPVASRPTLSALAIAASLFCNAAFARESRSPQRAGARRPEVLSGTFTGMVVTLFVPKRVVQSWLPQGLEIAKECPYQDHPVIILFGAIDDLTREKVVTLKPRFGRHYLETFVAVPYLRLENSSHTEPVLHFVRVYSDSLKGTTQGIKKYGWPKIYSPMQASNSAYRILREGPGVVFEATFDSIDPQAVDWSDNSLQRIQQMLSQTLVLKHEGAFHRYSFDFHFETASIASLPMDLEFRDGFMPQLQMKRTRVQGIAGADFGAFHIGCRYTKTPQ